MQPPFPSLTPTWHNDIYPAIGYTTEAVTHAGETIVITGAVGIRLHCDYFKLIKHTRALESAVRQPLLLLLLVQSISSSLDEP